jgi:hypothetical protein
VAFLLQRHAWLADADTVTERLVSDRMALQRRRVRKRRVHEVTDGELPVIRDGGFIRASVTGLRRLLATDPLALLLLDAVSNGLLDCPRAQSPREAVPSLSHGLERLIDGALR